ncbi:MAG: hypothetical protein JXQ90_15000 [Cyclobacteriaceae bacterium]
MKNIDDQLNFDKEGSREQYQKIFKELEVYKGFELDETFYNGVMRTVEKIDKKRAFWQFVLTVIVPLLMVVFGAIMWVFFFGFEAVTQYENIMGWAVCIGVLVVLIQVLDRKLLHKKKLAIW